MSGKGALCVGGGATRGGLTVTRFEVELWSSKSEPQTVSQGEMSLKFKNLALGIISYCLDLSIPPNLFLLH